MSADGYLRIPRRLTQSDVPPDRIAAILWIVGQASYAPREADGVQLAVGETPCLSAAKFEFRFKWTRKATRVFLEWLVSEKCAAETGLRFRIGQIWKGPGSGPGLGPAKGPTYLVSLVKFNSGEGPAQGPGLGPAQGPAIKEEGLEEGKKKDITPPSEGSAEGNGSSEKKTKRTTKRVAGWRQVPDDWQPKDRHRAKADELGLDLSHQAAKYRLHDFAKSHTDPDRTFDRWLLEAFDRKGGNRRNGNGKVADEGIYIYEPGPERF